MHSFSFIKTYNLQYTKCSIRQHIYKKYEKLCKLLNKYEYYYNCTSFSTFYNTSKNLNNSSKDVFLPKTPFVCDMMRIVEQIYGNIFFKRIYK